MALKQKIVRTVPLSVPNDEVWHLMCFFTKRFTTGAIARRAYYRVYEFRARFSDEAEEKALKKLKWLAARLVNADFFIIILSGCRYGCRATPERSYANCCSISDAMRDPKRVLKVKDASRIFVRKNDSIPLIRH